jgi:hypothetical protein
MPGAVFLEDVWKREMMLTEVWVQDRKVAVCGLRDVDVAGARTANAGVGADWAQA